MLLVRWTMNQTFRLQKIKIGILEIIDEVTLFKCCTTVWLWFRCV